MSSQKKIHPKLLKNIKKRIKTKKTNKQIGGDCTPSADGSFDNLIGQLVCMIGEGIQAIGSGVETAYSVMTLPADLAWDLERPNEPMPSNTIIPKLPI
jgi:hypothetical protein